MKNNFYHKLFFSILTLFFIGCFSANAQSINLNSITPNTHPLTLPQTSTGYTNTNGQSGITFVIRNDNPYPAILDSVGLYMRNTFTSGIQLWYTSTNLSGVPFPVSTAGGWTNAASLATFTSAPSLVGPGAYNPVFNNINFLIPANTVYRFIVVLTAGTGLNYTTAGAATTPDSFANSGVSLLVGDHQIGGQNVGYGMSGNLPGSGSFNPRAFGGKVSLSLLSTPCSGTPNHDTVVGNMNPCPGVTTCYSLAGNNPNSGLSYQWFQSVVSANGPWTATSAIDTNSFFCTIPPQPGPTWYMAVTTCDTSMLTDTATAIMVTPQTFDPYGPCYCYTSIPTATNDENIGQVTVGTFVNPTPPPPQTSNPNATAQYSNFDTLTMPCFIQGQTYPISVLQTGTFANLSTSWVKSWIDFNHNTQWTDPGEEIFSQQSNVGNTFNPAGTFTVPTTAQPGLTRMRFVLREFGSAANTLPCGNYPDGETEDYVICILAAGPHDPGVTNIQALPSSGCLDSNGTVVVTLTNYGSQNLDFSVDTAVLALNVSGPNGVTTYYDTLDGFAMPILSPFAANSLFRVFTGVNLYEGGCYDINTDTITMFSSINTNLVNDSLFNAIQVCNSRPNAVDYNLCLGDTIPSGQGLGIINCPTGLVRDSVLVPFTLSFTGNNPPNPASSAPQGSGQFASGTLPNLPPGANVISGELGVTNLVRCCGFLSFTTNSTLTRFSLFQGGAPPPAANLFHNGLQGSTTTAGAPYNYLSTPSALDLNSMYVGGVPVNPAINMGHWNLTNATAPNFSINAGGATTASLKIVYEYVPQGISWYEAPSGGVRISDSSVFDPLTTTNSIVTNSATAGTYTFYGACAADTNCRVEVDLVIQGITIDSVSWTNVLCNGDSSGSAYIQGSGGNTGLYYTLGGTIIDTNTTGQFTNLPAGLYSINVHDSTGCNGGDSTFTITAPPVLVIDSITSTTPSCAPGGDATLIVYAQGGTNPLSYSTGGAGQPSSVFANQLAGSYLITVSDSNACVDTQSHTIIAPVSPTWDIVSADTVNCFGDSSGTITLSTNPGTSSSILDSIVAPAAWVQPITGGIVSGLPAGTYTVRATDGNNCSIDTTISISSPTQMIWTSAVTDSVDCNGDSTGSLTVVSTGGTGTQHSYSINPVLGTQAPAGTFSNLNAQSFIVTATDSNGCTIDTSLTISEPGILVIDTLSVTPVGCNGDSTGVIVLTSTGGTPTVSYTINPNVGTQAPSGTISNLPWGTYSITGTDGNGCTATTSVTITQPVALTITSTVVDSVDCNGDTTGSVTIALGGGTPQYTCSILPNVGSQLTPGVFTGLSAGMYTINCLDANNCTVSTMVTVYEPSALQYTSVTTTNVSCNGAGDGTITVMGTGGTAPLSYSLTPPPFNQTGPGTFGNLPGGLKTITLTDANNCSIDSIVNIAEPAILSISPSGTTPINCNGDTTGQIVMTSLGGTAPVVYTMSPMATQSVPGSFSGLGAGTYIITGTDSNNCVAMDTVTLSEPTLLVIDSVVSTIPTCVPGGDATMTIYASGGTPPYLYSNGLIPTPGPTNVFTNQNAGSYNVEVNDALGCIDTTTHIINTPGAPTWSTITSTPVICFGDTNGTIALTTNGGSGTITFTVSGPSTPASNTSGNFSNLLSGNYTLTAVDTNNCSITSSVIVATPTALSYASALIDSVDCNGDSTGSITVVGAGGIAPYSYSITPAIGLQPTSGTFTGLPANTYTITMLDSNNCTHDTVLTVNEPVLLVISSPSSTDILCNGDSTGSIVLSSVGGTGPTTYTISPNLGNQTTAGTITDLPAGTYLITGTDQNSCVDTLSVTLSEPSLLVIDSIVSTIPSCVPGNDATMTVYASGGNNTSYTYNNGTQTQLNNNIFINQGAASYTVTVTDANGCTVTSTHMIATPGSPTWGSVTSVNVLCNGDSTGSINAVVIPGADTNITTSIILPIVYNGVLIPASNLPAAMYTIQAVDANGCSITSIVNISQPNPLLISSTQVDSVVCHGDSTGGITLSMMGGTGPYTYGINPALGTQATAGNFTGLPQGIYTITITDANNCTISTTLQVQEPAALQYTSVVSTNVSCNGANDGTITVSGTGGTGLLTYGVTPPPAIQGLPGNFTGLNGGMKTIRITDANGCTLDSIINIVEPNAFTIDTMSAQMVLCFGDSSGQFVMTPTGGTPAYSYTIAPVNGSVQGPNGTFSNLPAGVYTITATDGNNCVTTATYTISQPASAVSITNVAGTPASCVPGNDGTITITASGGTPTLTYAINTTLPIYQLGSGFTGLAGGNYFVYVQDTNGCTAVDSINLVTPGAPAWTSVTSSITTCNGDSTGSIIGLATGASAITYALSPLNGGTQTPAGNFTNLPAGNYTISASDANGCSVISAINVNEPPAITFTSVVADSVDCNGGNDGSITVTSTGGTGALSYSINPLATQAPPGTFTGLSAQNYTVTITDGNLCTTDSVITISEPPLLVIDTTSTTSVLCRGDSSGQLVMTSTGGTGIVNYSINTVPVQTNSTGLFTNLPAGSYTITATDGNNCVTTATYTITEPASNVMITNITGTTPTCNPGADGTVTVTAGGGTGVLTYTLSPTYIIPQGPNFTGLLSGTYLATAIDANGCIDTMSYNLGSSPIPAWNIVSSTDALCNGDSTGTISVTTTSGTAPITYSIVAPTSFIQSNATGNFTTLPAGTYTIEASDANNCSISTNVMIGEPQPLTFASVLTDSVSCNGLGDGQVTVVGAGGTTPYSYAIAPLALSNMSGVFPNRTAGTYTITLTDSNNCTATTQAIIYEPTPIIIDTISSVDVLCNGDSTGSISVQSSGGTGLIYHVIATDTNQSNPATYINYPAGMYTVTAIDANGCSVSGSISIAEPTPLTHTLTSTDVLCFGDTTGTITIVGSGGVGGYSYELYNPFQSNTSGLFTGLSAGTYTGVVIDANGCRDTTAVDTIAQPTQITFSTPVLQNIDCFGQSTGSIGIGANNGTGGKTLTLTGPVNQGPVASPANFQNLPAGIYIVTAEDANNCTISTIITLTQNPQLFFSSITNTEEICFGDSNAVITFQGSGGVGPYSYVFNNGIAPGTPNPSTQTTYGGLTTNIYNIEVIDALGCTYDSNYQILGPERINFPVFIITPTTCLDTEDGKITVEAAGGRGGRYTYSLEPGFYVNTNGLFRDLPPRQYTLRTTDTAGCFIDTTVDVPLPSNPLVVSITKEDLGCHGRGNEGKATANTIGGTPPYTYLWSSTPVQTTPSVSGLYQGFHTVDVVDANGCLVRDTLVIEPGPCCQEVFLPNAFSPNGDGRNDEFRILSTAGIKLQQFEVRNRWGERIWQSNNVRSSWDGTVDGEPVDIGTYYYIMRYQCLTDGQDYTMKGDVIVVR